MNGDKTMVLYKVHINQAPIVLVVPEDFDGIPVTRIENYAFSNCTNIKHLSLPSSLEAIGECAFENCTELFFVKHYESTYPAKRMILEKRAFAGCDRLVSCDFLTKVHACAEAFACCPKLDALHFKFEEIAQDVFWGCNNLESIMFAPKAYWDIEAFQNCKSLKTVIFYDDVDDEILEGALDTIKEKKIKCTDTFPFLDWVYEGIDLEIFKE